jgi:arylsulfatase A-like enzyme
MRKKNPERPFPVIPVNGDHASRTMLERVMNFMSTGLCLLVVTPSVAIGSQDSPSATKDPPNVLFISIDDLNDWVGALGVRSDVQTPNFDRLSSQGLLFRNASCPAPQCNPSRTAIMTGLNPSTTGIYRNSQWWRPVLPDTITLPDHFRRNGYWTEGAGKNFHHTPGFNDPGAWDNYYHWAPGVVELGWEGGYQRPPDPEPSEPGWPDLKPSSGEFDGAALSVPDEEMPDYKVVEHGIEFLGKYSGEKPFFLAVGIFRPHQPWYVPAKYFDLYPEESIELPPWHPDDREDLPEAAIKLTTFKHTKYHSRIVSLGLWQAAVQAYLASITFADTQLGRLLDALERSPFSENTIVVVWSDHGYHLGEKSHWQKWSLWQRSTRIPLAIAGPGIRPGQETNQPVGLIDLYPTLVDLCGLPSVQNLDGNSIVPLIRDPGQPWPYFALTTYMQGNHSLTGERWHYIRYADGSEELYDLQTDPNEWENLATKRESGIKNELQRFRAQLPEHDADPAPTKGAYHFDPVNYTWVPKEGRD